MEFMWPMGTAFAATAQTPEKLALNAYFSLALAAYDRNTRTETDVFATFLGFFRSATKERRSLYDNPYQALTDRAIAWSQGRNAGDSDENPYPAKTDMWHAWREGNRIRQRVETTIW